MAIGADVVQVRGGMHKRGLSYRLSSRLAGLLSALDFRLEL
jgi:hypothetical protein